MLTLQQQNQVCNLALYLDITTTLETFPATRFYVFISINTEGMKVEC